MQQEVKEAEEAGLLDCLGVVAKRSRLIAAITAAAAIFSLAVSLVIPKTYSAAAMVLPAQPDQGLLGLVMGQMGSGVSSLAGDLLGGGSPADTYVSILGSNAVSDAIIDRFRLMQVYDEAYRADTYKRLAKRVAFAAGKKDGIITIAVEDRDPKRAADIANAYVDELCALTLKLSSEGAAENMVFYRNRLAKASVELNQAEEALKKFQSRTKVLDIGDQAKAAVTGVAQLRAQLALQEVQLETLRRQFTDSSQEVKSAKTSVANLRAQIASLEGNAGVSSIPSVGTVPALGQEYVRLTREFKIKEAIFEALTKQYEMARLAQSKDVSTVQVIQRARVPDKKSKPKRALLVLGGAFAAFLSAVAGAFLLEYFEGIDDQQRARWRTICRNLTLRIPER